MKGFDQVSLYLLAICALTGLATPFLLAAKSRKPHLAVVAIVMAAWVLVVLISSAVML